MLFNIQLHHENPLIKHDVIDIVKVNIVKNVTRFKLNILLKRVSIKFWKVPVFGATWRIVLLKMQGP